MDEPNELAVVAQGPMENLRPALRALQERGVPARIMPPPPAPDGSCATSG
jgi:hypothetical protein